jgi:phospholipase/lecithinase/hemolysin
VKKITKQFSAYLLLFWTIGFAPLNYAVQVDKIIAFGDSLSDNGNIYALTYAAHQVTSYMPIIPMGPPYYEGRFTNGPVWVELLAKSLQVPLIDYAYGGAWVESAWDSKQVVPFDLGMQVNFYLVAHAADFHKDKHLFAIWIGANDYVQGREQVDYATTNAIAAIQKQLEWLIYYGGKNFLLINVPDLSQIT